MNKKKLDLKLNFDNPLVKEYFFKDKTETAVLLLVSGNSEEQVAKILGYNLSTVNDIARQIELVGPEESAKQKYGSDEGRIKL